MEAQQIEIVSLVLGSHPKFLPQLKPFLSQSLGGGSHILIRSDPHFGLQQMAVILSAP